MAAIGLWSTANPGHGVGADLVAAWALANKFDAVVWTALPPKVALQAAPVIGSISGAAINTLFINHYQDMARGHFTVKWLEVKYGAGPVREAYRKVLGLKTSSK